MSTSFFDRADGLGLILTCMDPRVGPILPADAFVIRTAGASLRPVGVDVAAAIAVKGVRTVAVVTHTDCAMRAADARSFGAALEAAGWTPEDARGFAEGAVAERVIGDEREAALATARELAERFPSVDVRAFVYRVEDGVLDLLSPRD